MSIQVSYDGGQNWLEVGLTTEDRLRFEEEQRAHVDDLVFRGSTTFTMAVSRAQLKRWRRLFDPEDRWGRVRALRRAYHHKRRGWR